MDADLVRAKLKDVVAELKGSFADVKAADGLMAKINAVKNGIPRIVSATDRAGDELGMKGADKKEFALDVLEALSPLPWWVELGLRPYLSWLIDSAAAELKKRAKL